MQIQVHTAVSLPVTVLAMASLYRQLETVSGT